MRTRPTTLLIGIGTTLALIVPAAHAATDNQNSVSTTQAANHFQVARNTLHVDTRDSQALAALNARWNAEAAAYSSGQAQTATARAIHALDARWNAEAAAYRAQLSGTASALSPSLPSDYFQVLRNTSI